MKKIIYFLISLFLVLSISCKKSTNDQFEEANKNIKERLLSKVVTTSSDEIVNDATYNFNYDGNNRISSISDGEENSFFTYDANTNKLTKISTSSDPLIMSDLYKSPYDLFEDGNVNTYDKNGNPQEVVVYQEDYLGRHILHGTITYDPNPNPFYYTIKAGGLIDVMDQIDFDFGTPTSPTLVKANKMLPLNNFKSMIFKNEQGETESEIHFNTTYDVDGYATYTTVTNLSKEGTTVDDIRYTYN